MIGYNWFGHSILQSDKSWLITNRARPSDTFVVDRETLEVVRNPDQILEFLDEVPEMDIELFPPPADLHDILVKIKEKKHIAFAGVHYAFAGPGDFFKPLTKYLDNVKEQFKQGYKEGGEGPKTIKDDVAEKIEKNKSRLQKLDDVLQHNDKFYEKLEEATEKEEVVDIDYQTLNDLFKIDPKWVDKLNLGGPKTVIISIDDVMSDKEIDELVQKGKTEKVDFTNEVKTHLKKMLSENPTTKNHKNSEFSVKIPDVSYQYKVYKLTDVVGPTFYEDTNKLILSSLDIWFSTEHQLETKGFFNIKGEKGQDREVHLMYPEQPMEIVSDSMTIAAIAKILRLKSTSIKKSAKPKSKDFNQIVDVLSKTKMEQKIDPKESKVPKPGEQPIEKPAVNPGDAIDPFK